MDDGRGWPAKDTPNLAAIGQRVMARGRRIDRKEAVFNSARAPAGQ